MARRRGVARGDRGGGTPLTPGNVPIPGFRHALDTGLPCGQVSSPSIRFRKELPAKSGPRGSSDPLSHAALNTAFVTPAAEFRAPHPDREVVMAADFFIGESLVGDGNEVAHIDLIIGSKAGHAGQAFVNTLSNNTDGFTKLLAVVTPNLPAKPDTLLFNKVTLKNATQAVQMFGPAQAAVARAVVDSVSSGVIPRDKVDDYCILVGVFIHWQAKNDKKIFDFNYRAVKESIERALKGQPRIDAVISGAKTATHPFAGGADMAAGERLLAAAQQAFFGPFRVSLMLDSNGSNTTAVAAVEKMVQAVGDVRGQRVLIIAGTGPVGIRAAGLFARAGAEVVITSRKPEAGERARDLVVKRFGGTVRAITMPDASEAIRACERASLLLNAGPAGVMLVPKQAWANRPGLKVVADVNAVPPLGIEGLDVMDDGVTKDGVRCFGALAIGNLKMKLHKACIARLFERNDLVLDAETIADVARELSAKPK